MLGRGGSTYRHLARALLILSIGDLAVLVDDHGPTAVTVTHAGSPSVVLGEEGLGVAEEELRISVRRFPRQAEVRGSTHKIVSLDAVDFAPRVHNPRVVGSNHGHDINALGLEFAQLLDVRRKVAGLATRSEGTWGGELARR